MQPGPPKPTRWGLGMELTIVRAGSELTPEGSLDLASRSQLVAAGIDVLRAHGCLTVNLRAVDFMDSTGIATLVELSKRAAALGARFAVVEPSPTCRRVLALTGLSDAWPPSGR